MASTPPPSPSKIPRRRPSSSSASSHLPPSTPRSNPWRLDSEDHDDDQDPALQDRRRTTQRSRTRTRSTGKLPPLSIEIPHSTPPNPPHHAAQSPRSRQPSQSHSQLYHPARTPRSQIGPAPPPMSERPRVVSSHVPRTPRDRDRDRDRTSTTGTTATAGGTPLATPATYESFDFPLPTSTTPSEEREARLALLERRRARSRWCCGLGATWLTRTSSRSPEDEETSGYGRKPPPVQVGERTRLLGGGNDAWTAADTVDGISGGKWQYVWGEVVCYAKHMLPPILLFVGVVLVIALFAYKQAIRDRFPPTTEEP